MITMLEVIKRTSDYLAARGVESPRLSAEHLLGHALGLGRMELYLEFERPLTEVELASIRPLVRRRGLREPLQYILGKTEFAGIQLGVDRRALIPRPETELLVEIVSAWIAARTSVRRVLDLGTGTGAIALALAQAHPEIRVVGVDRSSDALALATENVARNNLGERVNLLVSDWYQSVPLERYEVIVANPPYLSAAERLQTAPEVRDYEPEVALTATNDGLTDLENIVRGAPSFLAAGGLLALETGVGHHARLESVFRTVGFAMVEMKKDLTGRERFILAVLESPACFP